MGRPSHLKAAAVVAAVALAVAGGGATAVAAGILPAPSEVLADLFGDKPAQTQVIDRIGKPIGASASCSGVTITADAIIGDAHGFTVVFSVARDDGVAFDLSGIDESWASSLTLPLSFDEGTLQVADARDTTASYWFYDADPTDASIQYVAEVCLDTADGAGLVGKTARIHFGNLYSTDGYNRQTALASGSWDLAFQLGYQDTSIYLPCGQEVSSGTQAATISELAVSPVSVTVRYEITSTNSAPDLDDPCCVYNLPVCVTYADGSREGFTNMGGSISGSTITKTLVFSQIHDLSDISSITIGEDLTVPVS